MGIGAIVATRNDLPLEAGAYRMRMVERWTQQDFFFRYMRQHVALDAR